MYKQSNETDDVECYIKTLITFRLKWFIDKNLMVFQYEFKLTRVTCWSVVITFVNKFFFLVYSENE